MEDSIKPLHKFTNLCQDVMWLTSPAANGTSVPLFDTIIPIVSGQQNGSATLTYQTNNKEAAELICKICRRVAGWFFGYWLHVRHYKLGMVKKLMESFDIDAVFLAQFSEFNTGTLIVKTTFGDVDEQLERVGEDLGINQG